MSYTYKRAGFGNPSPSDLRKALLILKAFEGEDAHVDGAIAFLKGKLFPPNDQFEALLDKLAKRIAGSDNNLSDFDVTTGEAGTYSLHVGPAPKGVLTFLDRSLPKNPPDDDGPGDKAFFDRVWDVKSMVQNAAHQVLGSRYKVDSRFIEKGRFEVQVTLA